MSLVATILVFFVRTVSYVSFISREVVENRTNVKAFGPQFFLEGTILNFSLQIVSAINCPSFGNVWLSSVC